VEWVELRAFWEVPAEDWAFPSPNSNEQKTDKPVSVWEFTSNEATPEPLESQARCIARSLLLSGSHIVGPAIITEQDATTYIPTGWKAQITDNGYLRIKKDGLS